MKLHRATALALVGWYLMMAPTKGDVPLSGWTILESYDTAKECEKAKNDHRPTDLTVLLQEYRNKPDELPSNAKLYMSLLCISTDDPRLK